MPNSDNQTVSSAEFSSRDVTSVENEDDTSRSALVFRVILFQFKLFADGVRDIVLSPLSIGAGILGLLFNPSDPHRLFNRLLRAGHVSDKWINLFDNYGLEARANGSKTIDDLAHDLEDAVKTDYENNGISAKTGQKIEEILAELKRRRASRS